MRKSISMLLAEQISRRESLIRVLENFQEQEEGLIDTYEQAIVGYRQEIESLKKLNPHGFDSENEFWATVYELEDFRHAKADALMLDKYAQETGPFTKLVIVILMVGVICLGIAMAGAIFNFFMSRGACV